MSIDSMNEDERQRLRAAADVNALYAKIRIEKREKREKDLASLLARAATFYTKASGTPHPASQESGFLLAAEVAALHYTHLRILYLLEDRIGELTEKGPR